MAERRNNTEAHIVHTLTEMFLADGQAHTAPEVAERAGCSVTAARKVLETALAVVIDHEQRPSYSKNYEWQVVGAHKVTVYEPTKEHLRQLILDSRKS